MTTALRDSHIMPHTMTDTFDADWTTILANELTLLGYPPAAGESSRTLSLRYYNLKMRLVDQRPRQLLDAHGIVVPADVQAGYDLLRTKLTNGDDLRPHLSTRLSDIDFRDGLLSDWGILHFHLGTVLQATGFIDRTGPLLFARIEPDRAYILGVGTHHDFSRQRLVDTLAANWPDMMAQFELPNVLGMQFAATDAEIAAMRRVGITPIVQATNGRFYQGIGGGLTMSRWPTYAMSETNKKVKMIRYIRNIARSNLEVIAARLTDRGHTVPHNMHFTLHRGVGNQIILTENNTGVDVRSFVAF
jgi:hypothetical protein